MSNILCGICGGDKETFKVNDAIQLLCLKCQPKKVALAAKTACEKQFPNRGIVKKVEGCNEE